MDTDIGNRAILITGGTSGLGLELVRQFLGRGYTVVATGRQLLEFPGYENNYKLFQTDFSDLSQVGILTQRICETYDIELIINNAGILSPPQFTATDDGLEYTFQINYLSHLLINEIVLDKIRNNSQLNIVAVTSPAYRIADVNLRIQSNKENYSMVEAYTSSKLFLTLMCEYLPGRHEGKNLKCFSFNPGTFSSGIFRMQKPWFRGLYKFAAPFMRNPSKIAKILIEILINEDVSNGIIMNIRKRINTVPVIDKDHREAFFKTCYELLEPYKKQ